MSAAMVILNYNDALRTVKLAQVMSHYSCLAHIILVDNCSTDDSLAVMRDLLKDELAGENESNASSRKIHIVPSSVNGGYAKGNNLGIQYALSHFAPSHIFVANPDIMVEEQVLMSIVAAFEQNKGFGVIAPLVRQGYNVWKLPSFWGIIESLYLVWFNLDKRAIKKKLQKSELPLQRVGVVEGSLFCISTEAYQQIDGLDEGTFLYCEENILAKRLQEKQYKVGVLTDAYYDHFHSVSIKKHYKSKAKAFHNFYDSFQYYNEKYLHINVIQRLIFKTSYALAYVERCIYDLLKR